MEHLLDVDVLATDQRDRGFGRVNTEPRCLAEIAKDVQQRVYLFTSRVYEDNCIVRVEAHTKREVTTR